MKISKLGERELIKRIKGKVQLFSKDVVKGIGDDASVFNFDKNNYLLLTTDTLMENIHFKLTWFKPEQIGSKVVEINVSDIAAMGGYPKHCLVSLNLPKNLDVKFVDRLFSGINKTTKKYKINIIGGNIVQADQISITVSMVGFVEKDRLCLRSNSKVGDWICATGEHGRTKAALYLLYKNKKGSSIKSFLNIKAKLETARKLSSLGINAMQDNSDGLSSTVRDICEQSKTGAIIYKNKIPIAKEAIKDAKKLKMDVKEFALFGDYLELLFTIPKNKLKLLNKTDINFSVMGEIKSKKEGLFVAGDGKKIPLKEGYDHFKT